MVACEILGMTQEELYRQDEDWVTWRIRYKGHLDEAQAAVIKA